jgi:hypothetical protein
MKTSQDARYALGVRWATVCFAVVIWAKASNAQATFQLIEVGSGPTTTIELLYPFPSTLTFGGITSLTSPSGEVFTSASILEERHFGDLIKTFPTLESAFAFLAGAWQGSYIPRFPKGSPTRSFGFDVAQVSPDSVYRGLPQDFTVHDGDRIRSGETFLMSWNYESNLPAHLNSLQVVAHINSYDLGGNSIFGTPSPPGSSRGGGQTSVGGDHDSASFEYERKSEPGTSENRFLMTYTGGGSGTPLPAQMQLTLGATNRLDSLVVNHGDGDAEPFNNPPAQGLQYIRTAGPINLTLVPIPEPSTWNLAATTAALAALRATRERRTNWLDRSRRKN